MNKKGFTLIELLAVVVILSILVMITTPNVMNLVSNSKKTIYINNVKEFVTKATYLYNQEQYRNNADFFEKVNDNTYKIYLDKISSIGNKKDPFGSNYVLTNSYIIFTEPLNDEGLNEREIKVHIESCDKNNKCYYICDESIDNISDKSIKGSC